MVGNVGLGFTVFLGVRQGDTEEDAKYLAEKTAALRVFPDEQGKMNRSLADVGGAALVISQFTLHADTTKGNRPSFILAADPEQAKSLYESFAAHLRRIIGADRVATGRFQAHMSVEIVNDGPVTIELKSRNEQ